MGGQSIQDGDSFVIIGGFDASATQFMNTIHRYNLKEDSFERVDQKLAKARVTHAAFEVKASGFPPCS